MLVYNIGLSAVQANQAALQTIANNIANANTQGYHRQQVNLAQTNPIVQNNIQFGTGVMVSSIQRVVSSAADHALTMNLSQSADTQARLDALRMIEGLLTPASGSLNDTVSNFFDHVEQLAASPADGARRSQVVRSAEAVAQQITSLHTGLDQLQLQQAHLIQETVAKVNQLTSQVAALNKQIKVAQASGVEANTILDQRDQLVQDLGKLIDISAGSLANEKGTLVAAGGWLVVTDSPQQLSIEQGPGGSLRIMIGDRGPVSPASGQLAGLLAAHNEIIPEVRESIVSWSSALISGVNSAQATGLGLTGPASFLSSFNTVSNSAVPLEKAGTLLPIAKGSLHVTVTNLSTGERQTHEIAINPKVDSLQDVVNRLDAIAHLGASLSSDGRLHLSAAQGYAIDFAGRPDRDVDRSAMAGNAIPTITGTFNGTANQKWKVTAESSGQIGVTNGLKLKVTDAVTGQTVALLDMGSGYQANQPITIANGISIQLNAGTLQAGDSFTVNAVADADTSGFLTALGVNGLFETGDFRTVGVNNAIVKDPTLLAASRTGNSADAGQLARVLRFRDATFLSSGSETVEQRLASITSEAGLAVNTHETQLTQLNSLYHQLRGQQDSVSGVDPNEELLEMLQFQRAFQANAKFIATINNALDELLGILN